MSVRVTLAAIVVLLAPLAAAAQPSRLASDAAQIRAFRLSDAHLGQLRQVAATLARQYTPQPERPRTDAAMWAVLAMTPAYNERFSDRTVAESVRLIEAGHYDLASAIRGAGMSPRDYVLAHITLLLTVPVVAAEKTGRAASAADIAPENLDLVRRRWADIEAIWNDLRAAARPQ